MMPPTRIESSRCAGGRGFEIVQLQIAAADLKDEFRGDAR